MKLSQLVAFSMIVFILGVLPLTARADVSTGLAAYYKFNSTSGTSATDSSGNGNTATLVNGAAFVSTGKFYYGVTLDGSDDRIAAADSPSLDLTSFTIATWAYFKSTTATQYMVEKGLTGIGNYYFYYLSPNLICGFYDGVGWRELQVSATPTINTWAHYACAFDNVSKVLTMYKNGASIGNTTLNYIPQKNTGGLYVGWSIVQGNYSFNGYLDDTRVYSRALTSSDVSELYNYSPSNTACSSPAGNGGDLTYDATARIMGYCNSASWIQIGAGPKGGGGCTNPVKSAGAIIYDSVNRVMKHCNGQEWATWGVVGGIGVASSCTSPTGVAGALTYNADYRVLQYCDGKTWEMVGGYQPTLSMEFAANKYTLNGTSYASYPSLLTALGGTFTRASIATYFDATGTMQTATSGTPRLDYDPVTHVLKGLLIEETRTNKVKQSSAFDNTTNWTSGGPVVTANVAVAPDGTTTADKVDPSGSGLAFMAQALTWTAGQYVTFSIYVKAAGASLFFFEEKVAGTLWATQFDLTSGTISNTKAGDTSTMQNVGNGWWRISMTRAFTAATNTNNQYNTVYVDQYAAGTPGNAVYLWGAQFEIGQFPTSYIPTTTATVTRANEWIDIPTGPWFNAVAGTMVSEGIKPYRSNSYPGTASLDDGTGNNAIHTFIDDVATTQESLEVVNGNTINWSPLGTTYVLGSTAKMGVAYGGGNFYASFDGSTAVTAAAAVPPVTEIRVGADRGAGALWNGWIQEVNYYPFMVPSTVLKTMTQHN